MRERERVREMDSERERERQCLERAGGGECVRGREAERVNAWPPDNQGLGLKVEG